MFDSAKSKREDGDIVKPQHYDINLTDFKGTRYFTADDGSRRRFDPKPWRGKSERRKAIKARREDRNLALENLKA